MSREADESTEPDEGIVAPPDAQKTLEWIAVLCAADFDYRLSHNRGRWVIHVPTAHATAARAEIEAYEDSCRERPPPRTGTFGLPLQAHPSWSAAWVCGLLAAVYLLLGPYESNPVARVAAGAEGERIACGETWRLVTALTLHSGPAHLAGNLAAVLGLGHAVCRALGSGFAWLLILGTGVIGNAAASWAAGPGHASVGASTAAFGALGILSGYQAVWNWRQSGGNWSVWNRAWIPLGAGLALLGLLGTGPRSDLLSHGFGFGAGLVLGGPFGWPESRRTAVWIDRSLELVCLCAVMSAWRAALIAAGAIP